MAKQLIPAHLKGKELHKFLVQNKSSIMAQKKSMIKTCDAVSFEPSLFVVGKDGAVTKTAAGDQTVIAADTIRVKTVANTAYWMDSHRDVSIEDCWNKSIRERLPFLKHLKNHDYRVESEIGDTVNVYGQEMSLVELGINMPGTTQCLVWESDVRKSYDEVLFNKYKAGKINQHSIGLWYVKMELAINDPEYKEEFAVWNKYIGKVINKADAENGGYFWALIEIKLIENSAVLFGSNQITPTLEVKGQDTEEEPSEDTLEQPSTKSMFASIGASMSAGNKFSQIGKQLNNSN